MVRVMHKADIQANGDTRNIEVSEISCANGASKTSFWGQRMLLHQKADIRLDVRILSAVGIATIGSIGLANANDLGPVKTSIELREGWSQCIRGGRIGGAE